MARRDDIEERLAQLSGLRREPDAGEVRRGLKAALTQKRSGLLVAKAAELAAELSIDDMAPQMEEAFHRLLRDPIKRDKGCLGKTALAKALVELEQPASEIYLQGVSFVQMEPTWGGSVDVASQLRGWCAHGLIRARHPRALLEVTALLVDPERPARLAAVDALGDSGREGAEAVLRLKVLSGDSEPEVVAECFNSLLRLDAERSLDFVAEFLASDDEALAEGAALALGDSRLEGAIDLLHQQLELTVDQDRQRSLYLGLALTRRQRAVDILLQTVEDESIGRAEAALPALALHRHDEGLSERLRELVSERRSRALEKIWREEFEA